VRGSVDVMDTVHAAPRVGDPEARVASRTARSPMRGLEFCFDR
jgi:hypothetical protein